jgi:isoquinoline 1-oxidoreductase alpha subunit
MRISVNGTVQEIDVDADTPLLWALRDVLGLTGTKFGCGAALCGACTVLVDGVAKRSCVTLVSDIGEQEVTTIEQLAERKTGRALQKAWLEVDVVQCGYCQSGQLMQATALLEMNPEPDDSAIDAVMAGNICRCGTYGRIRTAIKQAAADLQKQEG